LEKEDSRGSETRFRLDNVKDSLLNNPGKTAAPESKESFLPKAAVAMILHPDSLSKELLVLLVKRITREGDPWSGHMAFPGGRHVETDQSLLGTVIREVIEEIGVDLRQLSILGSLDELVAGGNPITVTPFVAVAEDELTIVTNPKEIDTFIWIPLSFFSDRKNIQPYSINRQGQNFQVPAYKFLGDQVIWGMTLRIIEDFLRKISRIEVSRKEDQGSPL
jgi:8-oxo-dGTP pyrophosphatase MutT (NUDIX family)